MWESSVIGFVGRGRSRVMAIKVELDPGTTLLRPVTSAYIDVAKKLYEGFIDEAIGRRQAEIAKQAQKVAEMVPVTKTKVTVISKPVHAGCGHGSWRSDDQRGAVIERNRFDKNYRPERCWKLHRTAQYKA